MEMNVNNPAGHAPCTEPRRRWRLGWVWALPSPGPVAQGQSTWAPLPTLGFFQGFEFESVIPVLDLPFVP